jgi:hypothetical protein
VSFDGEEVESGNGPMRAEVIEDLHDRAVFVWQAVHARADFAGSTVVGGGRTRYAREA